MLISYLWCIETTLPSLATTKCSIHHQLLKLLHLFDILPSQQLLGISRVVDGHSMTTDESQLAKCCIALSPQEAANECASLRALHRTRTENKEKPIDGLNANTNPTVRDSNGA